MAKIKKFEDLKWPAKDGWYWILPDGSDDPIPCWVCVERVADPFCLPAGLGDSSSSGLFEDDIERIGPEIIQPEF